jgi:hypothetical protein
MLGVTRDSRVRWVALLLVLSLVVAPFVYVNLIDHPTTPLVGSGEALSAPPVPTPRTLKDRLQPQPSPEPITRVLDIPPVPQPPAAVPVPLPPAPTLLTSTQTLGVAALPVATPPQPLPSPAIAPPSALAPTPAPAARRWDLPPVTKRALFFSMDSLTQRVEEAKRGMPSRSSSPIMRMRLGASDAAAACLIEGGAAGEITVRESLQRALLHFGIASDVAGSDPEFLSLVANPGGGQGLPGYALIALDPWTFVDRTWSPHSFLRGAEHKLFIMDFFGKPGPEHGLAITPDHILTPFPTPWGNGFLGYLPASIEAAAAAGASAAPLKPKLNQGVVWGKRAEYFRGKTELLVGSVARHFLSATTRIAHVILWFSSAV